MGQARLAYVNCRHCGRRTMTANPGFPATCSVCNTAHQRNFQRASDARRTTDREISVTQADPHRRRAP